MNMIYNTPKEIISELRHIMDLNNISSKELAVKMHKSQQSVSQIFSIGNPKLNSLLEICNALDLQLDINFILNKNDTN